MSVKVLIADAIKPSLVMSSEVFKDKIPGATVVVASTGAQAISMVETEKPDICLVDFDLPDVDGPALVVAIRKVYQGPILLTAYPDEHVEQAVLNDLFAYNDASAWIKKPVRFDDLAVHIDKFLLEQHRTGRRFQTKVPTRLIAKAAGRGKRAPKAMGVMVNLSLGGACIKLEEKMQVKKKQELTLALDLPVPKDLQGKLKERAKAKTTSHSSETRIKARVCWIDKGQVGLQFVHLTDYQLNLVENYLREKTAS